MPEETQDEPSQDEVQDEAAAQPAPPEAEAPETTDAQASEAAAAQPAPPEAEAPGTTDAQAPEASDAQAEPAEKAADEEEGDGLPECTFETEDVGTLKKKITITVPPERIVAKREEMFGELGRSAQVPGFRIGRAPRRLLEKRFGREVGEDVRNALVGESLGQVEEKTELKTVGEPELDLDEIKLPESGPLVYSLEVEVAPEFDLPELEGIAVEKRTIEVNDERINRTLDEWRLDYARYEPTADAAAAADTIVAAARISGEGIETLERDAQTLRVAPGQVEGLPLVDLGTALAGKKAGETATLRVNVAQAHPNEAWRGKTLTVELTINEVRKRVLPALDDAFAQSHGMDKISELRDAVRKSLSARVEQEARHLMREQVRQHLLDSVVLDIPQGAAERHTARVLQRRAVDLLHRGVPRERIDENLTELQAAADEEARLQLKLEFILARIAEEKELEVGDEEVNARITEMARQAGRRPERLRQELDADGSLSVVYLSLRDEKVLDLLLDKANVTEVPVEPAGPKPAAKTKKKAKKKAEKEPEKAADAAEPPAAEPPPDEADGAEQKAPAKARKKAE